MPSVDREPVRLKDYAPTPYLIEQCHLHVDLHDDHALVTAVLHVSPHPQASPTDADFVLDGDALVLERIALNGTPLSSDQYQVDAKHLRVLDVPDVFTLETQVRIDPQNNTQLMGLYESNGMFCTQCETEGFRRITYFYDRPDVMSVFTTTVTADKKAYPLLLSNGNQVASHDLADGRHAVTWHDPSLKPCYLFAMVAGDFEVIEDQHRTPDGRDIALRIYLDKASIDQGHHAMASLKRAMLWDERVYGRVYDLDQYMIVGVSDFNFGAMENKGLNIFNTKCMLASPEVATDRDFIMVEGVIAHEYFHNWSGNRVTLRDWFQLTLKEGLTVFRDQTFTESVTDASVARIDDVCALREAQFPEDAGPLAHPIRPEEYLEISNFYTATVYNKGAEVIRMVRTLLGKEAFHRAMEQYFEDYDGRAITTEDFLSVMASSSGLDLTLFKRWYHQAGTPDVHVAHRYDADKKSCVLTLRQQTDPTPGQPDKKAFLMPIKTGLLSPKGEALTFSVEGGEGGVQHEHTLWLSEDTQSFVLQGVEEAPLPSVLRHFSAPVNLHQALTLDDLLLLFRHDSDGFNRWEAGQRAMRSIMMQALDDDEAGRPLHFPAALSDAIMTVLNKPGEDLYYLSRLIAMPTARSFLLERPGTDVLRLCRVYDAMHCCIAERLRSFLFEKLEAMPLEPYVFNMQAVGVRALRHALLTYLGALNEDGTHRLAFHQYRHADNLTDKVAAMSVLNQHDTPFRSEALQAWYEEHHALPLVLDRWFAFQSTAALPGTFETVKALVEHPEFDTKNPNRVRALLGAFASQNLQCFHEEGGAPYVFYTDQLLAIDRSNSQLASRLVQPLTQFQYYDQSRQVLLLAQLARILKQPNLSKDVYELARKSVDASEGL
jgi:aminopeptidase N